MLSEVERVLLDAVHAGDPPSRLRELVAEAGDRLTSDERSWLLAADADGLRMTGLLVVKLRFERVLRGDPALRREFDADPRALLERFRRYACEVPATAVFPEDESREFTAWSS